MAIVYSVENDLSVEDFITVLQSCSLGVRRPLHHIARLQKMLDEADIIITARIDGKIVGVSRAITDFAYCCYLSDLAVDDTCQKQGIGKALVEKTHAVAGPETALILTAAPDAVHYYAKIGMEKIENGWIIKRKV